MVFVRSVLGGEQIWRELPLQAPVATCLKHRGMYVNVIQVYNITAGVCVRVMQCSFSVCLRNREESHKAVERYVDEWRAKKQTPFRCYYDTMSLDTVIVQKMYSTADVVHRSASVIRVPLAPSLLLPVHPDLPDLPDATETVVHGGQTGLKVFI